MDDREGLVPDKYISVKPLYVLFFLYIYIYHKLLLSYHILHVINNIVYLASYSFFFC